MSRMRPALPASLVVVAAMVSPAWAHRPLDEQIRDVTLRLQSSPRDASLLLKRGELHRAQGEWGAAERDYVAARAIDPSLDAVDLCFGTMLLQSGSRLPEARSVLDRFLTKRPGHSDGLVTRARVRAKLGDHEGAVRDYDAAIASFAPPARPQPEHYLERADELAALGDARLDEAVRGLDEGLARLGEPITLQMRAIDLDVARGRHDAALARVDRILSHPGRRERWLKRRGDIQRMAGRLQEAHGSYQEALAAITALPEGRRAAAATRKLEEDLRDALASLDTEEARPAPSP